ncbi:Antifungal protein ginkbilobin-like protein 2 [Linum grandiflorum]
MSQQDAPPIGVPACSQKKIHKGDPFAGALVDVLKQIWLHADELTGDPSTQHCYQGHDQDELATAYGSASCFQGLSVEDCTDGLNDALKIISDECGNSYGAQVTIPTCFLRFESYSFC